MTISFTVLMKREWGRLEVLYAWKWKVNGIEGGRWNNLQQLDFFFLIIFVNASTVKVIFTCHLLTLVVLGIVFWQYSQCIWNADLQMGIWKTEECYTNKKSLHLWITLCSLSFLLKALLPDCFEWVLRTCVRFIFFLWEKKQRCRKTYSCSLHKPALSS